MKQLSIPYLQIRGGSSKGIYFLKSDLPDDITLRDQVILSVVGRGMQQIDGLGGAIPIASKVAVISPSKQKGVDIDYQFIQVVVGENRVDSSPNCGNILTGIGVYAIETGMVETTSPTTSIKVKMLNTGSLCELVMPTPNGQLIYHGEAKIDGVLGTSAPIICNYQDIAGAACGSLFPTGKHTDIINTPQVKNIPVTCIDNGMPVILIAAEKLNLSGNETVAELNANNELKEKLESIRLLMGPKMNLGDVTNKVVPKMCLISKPQHKGAINTRCFIPHTCHPAIGVLAAVTVATACLYKDSVSKDIANVDQSTLNQTLSIEHPSGEFSVSFEGEIKNSEVNITKVGLLRSARLLAKGEAYYSL